jgi:hypothetical protein
MGGGSRPGQPWGHWCLGDFSIPAERTDNLSSLCLSIEIYVIAEPSLEDMSRITLQVEKYHEQQLIVIDVLRF